MTDDLSYDLHDYDSSEAADSEQADQDTDGGWTQRDYAKARTQREFLEQYVQAGDKLADGYRTETQAQQDAGQHAVQQHASEVEGLTDAA